MPDTKTRVPTRSVTELYGDHIASATRLAFLLTGSRASAEDIAQDAFLRAAARLFAIRDPDRFGAYLRRTVIREVAASRRSHARETGREARVHRSNERTTAIDDPGSELDFVSILQSLPDKQRLALVLRFGLDLSEQQTADAMGCPPGTVKSTVSRALASLREVLAVEGNERTSKGIQ